MNSTKEKKTIDSIYGSTRSLLIHAGPLIKVIEEIPNRRLREIELQQFEEAEDKLLFFHQFLLEVLNCESESDIEMLLDLNSIDNEEVK